MPDLRLVVNGRGYGGWKTVQVVRSIETMSGSFSLGVNDRWDGQTDDPWPIAEEDACRVEIDGVPVIDGYVDRRSISLSATDRSLSYAGRDRCAALVDCSAELDKWTFRNVSALDVARKVAEPFGIAVSAQAGLALPKLPSKLVVSPGEDAFGVIDRAARMAGVLAVTDGAGGVLLTRAGTTRAASLVQGDNVLVAAVEYDASDRFSRYVVATQTGGTDAASGGATRILASASDAGIRRTDRVLLIRPESGVTADYARKRADWEARVRAAKAESVTIVVVGWLQPGGGLWPVNALCRVATPSIGVDGDMLISQVEFSISDTGGETTQIRLVRPDAFTPEPKAVVKGSALWKELAPRPADRLLGAGSTLASGIAAGIAAVAGDD